MPKFIGFALLSALVLLVSNLSAQTATTTVVTGAPGTGAYGTSTALTAAVSPAAMPFVNAAGATVLPTGTVQFYDGMNALSNPAMLTPGSGFLTTPFSPLLGAIDPSFNDVSGQVAGDLNGDGVQDLLIYRNIEKPASAQSNAVVQASIEVQAFLSTGTSAYASAAAATLTLPIPPPSNDLVPYVPVLADLNGDGKLDLLIGPSVAYGNGDGTFQQPVTLSFLANGYMNTFSADLNGDGKADVLALVIPANLAATTVTLQMTVFLNQGDGAFQAAGTFPIATGTCPCEALPEASLAFADLNGDGKLDILAQSLIFEPDYVAPSVPPSPALTSLLNNGDGVFAAGVMAAYTPPAGTASNFSLTTNEVSDFNGDGKADIALVFPSSALLSGFSTPVIFLPGNGDGTFGAEIDSTLSYPMAQQGQEPAGPGGAAIVTDANLDGLPDLVFGSAAVALGNGHGSFTAGPPVQSAAQGDFGKSLGLLQPAGSALPYLVFAGNPAGTGAASVSFVAIHNLNSTAVLAPMLLSAGTHSITAKYSGDADYAASTSAASVVTIAPVATTTTLTSTANPAYRGETATVTVSVRSSGSVPTGTVTFSCGPSPMSGLNCPEPLTLDGQGNVTFQAANTGSLNGSLALEVAYSGDASHSPSTAQFTQVFENPVNVSLQTNTITVKSGQSVSTQLSVSGNAGFTGPAYLGCDNLPMNASCIFNPAAPNVAGATAQTVTLTILTSGSTSALAKPLLATGVKTLLCGLFAGSLLLFRRRRRWTHWIGIAVIGLGLLPMGCGGSKSSNGSGGSASVAPGTYPLTITSNDEGQESGPMFVLVVQ